MPYSLQPNGLQLTMLLCSRDSPGKNTGVGCHFLLQGIFPTQGSNPGFLHWRQIFFISTRKQAPLYLDPAASTQEHQALLACSSTSGATMLRLFTAKLHAGGTVGPDQGTVSKGKFVLFKAGALIVEIPSSKFRMEGWCLPSSLKVKSCSLVPLIISERQTLKLQGTLTDQ